MRLMLLIFGLFLVCNDIIGQELRPTAFIGFRLGYLELVDVDEGSLNVGLTAGYDWGRLFEVEASVDYHTAEYDLQNRSTYALQFSVMLLPWRHPHIHAYLVGGVGAYFSDYDEVPGLIDISDSWSTDAGYHAGFGGDFFITGGTQERIFITIDGRWLFTQEEPENQAIKSDGRLVTVGIKYRF